MMYVLLFVVQVETIGDAYMVVGGLPERNTIHAECVANQALDMMHYCQQVKRPDNGENVVVSKRERERGRGGKGDGGKEQGWGIEGEREERD